MLSITAGQPSSAFSCSTEYALLLHELAGAHLLPSCHLSLPKLASIIAHKFEPLELVHAQALHSPGPLHELTGSHRINPVTVAGSHGCLWHCCVLMLSHRQPICPHGNS